MEADDSGSITSHNLYGTHLAGRSVQGEDYYYLYNAHGDVVMLLDAATGAIAGTYRYDAFGNVLLETGTPNNSVTYAGYQYDEETGLYYLNARYYDSATARFLTEDTYRGSYRDPLSLNRYTYCHNNPVAYTDPSGHIAIVVVVGGLVGGLFSGGGEVINQLFFEKDEFDWKAVVYETGTGALWGALGGATGGLAGSAGKTIAKTTTKSIAKKAIATGATEMAEGFVADVGRQVIVDGKSFSEVDYGQSIKTGAISGLSGAGGAAVGAVGDIAKSTTKNASGTLTEIATKNLDDVVDATDDSIVRGVSKGESGTRIIPGIDGAVTGGDSTKLGKNMMEMMGLKRGAKWTGYQAQHIIPAEMADHQVLQKIGMDLDDASNGIFLRMPLDDVSAMSRHRGYHSVYSDFVRSQLDAMDINQSSSVLQQQVLDLQNNLRRLQQIGLPLYSGQGATIDLWQRSLNKLR